jgi:hypothetical protein
MFRDFRTLFGFYVIYKYLFRKLFVMLQQQDAEISCEFLDTASIYTKYHEYHFLNHQIILFHAYVVQIWSMQKNSTKRQKLTKYL